MNSQNSSECPPLVSLCPPTPSCTNDVITTSNKKDSFTTASSAFYVHVSSYSSYILLRSEVAIHKACIFMKSLLSASPQHHVLNLAAIALSIAVLRIDVVALTATRLLSIVLPSSSIYSERKPAGYFKPLSMIDWLAHLATMPLNLEIVSQLFSLASENKNNSSPSSASKTYLLLGYLYALAHFQALVTLCSHSLVNVDGELEVLLLVLEFILMRWNVFGTGIILLFWRGKDNIMSTRFFYAMMLIVTALIITDVADFGTPAGIFLSTLSMFVVVIRKELPVLFRISWCLLGFIPALIPSTDEDVGHTIAASMINLPLAGMAYSLRSYQYDPASLKSKGA